MSRTIKVGDTVRSIRTGRLYRVDDILIPASGGHRLANRTYGVTDTETHLPNAFDGTEIERVGPQHRQEGTVTTTKRTWNVQVRMTIEVDMDTYAETYGLSRKEAYEDARQHLEEVAWEASAEAIARLDVGAKVLK